MKKKIRPSSAAWGRRSIKFAVVLLTTTFALADQRKVARDLDDHDQNSEVNVIVQFRHPAGDADHQKVQALGGQHKAKLDLGDKGAYSVRAGSLQQLAADPDVLHISQDHRLHGSLDLTTDAVNADFALRYGWDGAGIGIAVIDSGIASHADLQKSYFGSRVLYSESFVD